MQTWSLDLDGDLSLSERQARPHHSPSDGFHGYFVTFMAAVMLVIV